MAKMVPNIVNKLAHRTGAERRESAGGGYWGQKSGIFTQFS
jgi:hypothetical protein